MDRVNWNKKTIPPRQPVQEQRDRFRSPSPPLMRFFGGIGFITCGLTVLYLGQHLLGVDSDVWRTSNWNVKTVLLLVISLAVALIGGLIGTGFGASIDIKSERGNHILNALWHYLANGSIIWFFLLTLCLTKIYGKEGLKQFADEIDMWYFSVATVGISTAGCLLIGAVLLAAGLLKENSKPRIISCLILSLPISTAMGYAQFSLFAIDTKYWIFMGTILPVALIPVSAYMMSRDREQRNQLLQR